jgi:hypothetical protein
MNGRTKKYKESLAKTSDPVLLSQCPDIKMDLPGLMKYAKEQGKEVTDLTEEEKKQFIFE